MTDTRTHSLTRRTRTVSSTMGHVSYMTCLMSRVSYMTQVKTYKNGFINNPLTLGVGATVKDVRHIKDTRGFSGIPITGTYKVLHGVYRYFIYCAYAIM